MLIEEGITLWHRIPQTFVFRAVFLSGVLCKPPIMRLRRQRQKQDKKQDTATMPTLKHILSHDSSFFCTLELLCLYCTLSSIFIRSQLVVVVIRLHAPLDLGISRAQ